MVQDGFSARRLTWMRSRDLVKSFSFSEQDRWDRVTSAVMHVLSSPARRSPRDLAARNFLSRRRREYAPPPPGKTSGSARNFDAHEKRTPGISFLRVPRLRRHGGGTTLRLRRIGSARHGRYSNTRRRGDGLLCPRGEGGRRRHPHP